MQGPHGPLRVVEEEGVAVGHPHPEEEAGGAGEEAVPLPEPRPLHRVDLGAVDLAEARHGRVAEGREHPALVLGHPLGVVPGGGGEVEAAEGSLGDPAFPGGEAVGHREGVRRRVTGPPLQKA